jgi:flavin-dependent dehydrogenase
VRAFDAVVVGAGSAGSAAARALALRGLRVALVDARPLERSGARWVNFVPGWMFDEAGLTRPTSPELRGGGGRFTVSVDGTQLSVAENPCLGVDMRGLVGRLQADASAAGVVLLGGTRLAGLEMQGGRAVALKTSAGRLRAALFVDATGTNGALRREVPALAKSCPALAAGDLCSAAMEVREVLDPDAAAAWRARYGLAPDEVLSRPAVAGGYSVMNLAVDAEGHEAELLTGALVGGPGASGPALVDRLCAEHPWIGPVRFGGAGLIPVRRPYSRLVAPGIALVGDAACMVFPAHGSGVGFGLLAARTLAESVDAADPGNERGLNRYAAAFLRRWGGTLAAYDLFRRLTERLDASAQGALIRAGVVSAASMRRGLDQRLPYPGPDDVAAFASVVTRVPRLAARAALVVARMPALVAAYGAYPEGGGERSLTLFERTVARLLGVTPDF